MKILIISIKGNLQIYPLGPLYIAKQLETKHEVRILNSEFYNYNFKTLRQCIESFSPDYIMISIRNLSDFNENAKAMLGYIKSLNIPFKVGGAAINTFRASALPFLGIHRTNCFIGEFEQSISKLFPGMKNIHDINKIKMPDGSFLDYTERKILSPKRVFGIECKRGCPFHCNYCSYPNVGGNKIRKRNPMKIVDNIKSLSRLGITKFFFTDAIFNMPRDYHLKVCKLILKERIDAEFAAYVNPINIGEREVAVWKRINLHPCLGIDSFSDKSLAAWSKPFRSEDVRKAINTLNKHNVRFHTFLLLGSPGQTMEDVKQELELAKRAKLPRLRIQFGAVIYPRTRLWKIALKASMIKRGECLTLPKLYISQLIDKKEAQNLINKLRAKIWFWHLTDHLLSRKVCRGYAPTLSRL